MLEPRDVHWAAGFLEGEGWFGAHKASRGMPRMEVSQRAPETLLRLQSLFGGGVYAMAGSGHTKPHHIWRLGGIRAACAMLTLYCLMSEKRKAQIDVALRVWKTLPPKMPKGMGLRNPKSPFYRNKSALWNRQ